MSGSMRPKDDQGFRVPQPSRRLSGLPSYGRGRAGQSAHFSHRLGSNEAPDAPSPVVQAAVSNAMGAGHRYPDLRGESLTEALAKRHGLPEDCIAVSAGSIVMLDQLMRAYCDAGDTVVIPWRSYEAYPIIAGIAGARLVEVPLDADHRIDPGAMLQACADGARIVVLCNPNNPTGTALAQEELDALLHALPKDILIILDEAYADYDQDRIGVATSPVARLEHHANLVVLRTFSKAWGLAGMRIGYCLADPQIIDAINAVAPPFPLSAPAIAGALATLKEDGVVVERVACSVEQRGLLTEGLEAIGLPVARSGANFVWLAIRNEADDLTHYLREAGIVVRCFSGEGVRITTGTAADTEAVLAAVNNWRSSTSRL